MRTWKCRTCTCIFSAAHLSDRCSAGDLRLACRGGFLIESTSLLTGLFAQAVPVALEETITHGKSMCNNRQQDAAYDDQHPQGFVKEAGRRRAEEGRLPQADGQTQPAEEDRLGRQQAAAHLAQRPRTPQP